MAHSAFSMRSSMGRRNWPSLARKSGQGGGIERGGDVVLGNDVVAFGHRWWLLCMGVRHPMIRHHRAPEPPPIFSTFHYGRDIIVNTRNATPLSVEITRDLLFVQVPHGWPLDVDGYTVGYTRLCRKTVIQSTDVDSVG